MKRLLIFFFFIAYAPALFGQCDSLQGEVKWRFWKDIPTYAWNSTDFYKLDRFPNGPDDTKTLFSLSTPNNYTDFYGSQVRGYIRTDSTDQVVFNVNGDNEVYFRLSTDHTSDNLVDIQGDTSDMDNLDTLTLQAGNYYYFELTHYEAGGRDFASVEWKAGFLTNGITDTLWTTVGGDYIYGFCEPVCDLRGTPCDDGNANTQNDQYDGNCHCVGDPITTNSCVGERANLKNYLYKNLPGNEISILDNVITNGTNPDTIETLGEHFLGRYFANEGADPNYGAYFRGFITVPVTGLYSFNITGVYQNVFYISSDDSPANKTANQLWTYWGTNVYNHDVDFGQWNPEDQTAENIFMEADKYYYIELRNKGNDSPWNQFNLFWKRPDQVRDEWLRIPTFYFFDYTCNEVCVANGVGCNDGDPYTANDQWDGNCNCAGTPCVAPNCDDPTTSYNAPEECETTNLIDNRADDAWLSCTPLSAAPNTERTGQHWIQYDFGALYNLGTTQVWNYNVDGATAAGFQQVVIDYSSDGINWTELGTYNWDLASGATDYEGFVGPDFTGITAQYVLISSMDDPNSCRGFSKIAFNAVGCPTIQFVNPGIDATLLDQSDVSVEVDVTGGEAAINRVDLYLDGNWIGDDQTAPYSWMDLPALQNLTYGDYDLSAVVVDANGTECELATQIHLISIDDTPCQTGALVLDNSDDPIYRTDETITSTSVIATNATTNYIAAQSITLQPGFHAEVGSNFLARIADCPPANLAESTPATVRNLSNKKVGQHQVKLYPNPVVSTFIVEIDAYQAGTLDIRVYDVLGKELGNLTRKKLIEKGQERIEIGAELLTAGLYYCKIKIGEASFTKSFVRVDAN